MEYSIPQDDSQQSLVVYTPRTFTIDEMVQVWLHSKSTRSGSVRTAELYTRHMESFRELLHKSGMDLDSEDEVMIATLAQGWAAYSPENNTIAASTYNLRIAIVSSYYVFAKKHRWVRNNPMDIVDRRQVTNNNAALPIDTNVARAAMKSINQSKPVGVRDYALLTLMFATGRRVSEIADLRCGDIALSGNIVTVTWKRCKGGKVMYDKLPPKISKVLVDYLQSVYGQEWQSDAPVWVSYSRQHRRLKTKHPIGTQAIADVCTHHLGISKAHACRHTFAVMMEEAGAKLSDIGARLGHSNLNTTSTYMHRLHSAENIFSVKLEDMLGIGDEEE